ncbi:glycosyltransferase family 87 protein [Microlunatus ginsengisoli]|uniref:Glycosyltransferase family 87 protein n=1 Tax=Microlunatus ginsengisoli TaxID=363863 RepID=A0ABP6ZVF5_9ACTN
MLGRIQDWFDRRGNGWTVLGGWILTRILILLIFALFERFVIGDVYYYHRKIVAMFDVGLPQTLNEYPTPVAWILTIPYVLGAGTQTGYAIAFIAGMMALDAAFTFLLWRHNGRTHDRSINFWLLFVLFVGPLSYLRFDILPAVLAGAAVLYARRTPWLTGVLTGLGAAIKLWPALLWLAFLAHRPTRRTVTVAFLASGVGLALVSLVFGGWSRLVSPLTWQSGRGLQIESIWATPLMIARAGDPRQWTVDMSPFQAYEIFGPGVSVLLVLSNVATLLGLAAIIALYVRGFRAKAPDAVAVGLVVLSIVGIMIVTNKTLSPQYLLWLGGPMAALLLLKRNQVTEPEQRTIRRLAGQLLVLALLTQLVFPLLYNGLLGGGGRPMLVLATAVTALRNLALLAFAVELVIQAWRFLGVDRASVSVESA